jgi:hypothetical protein
MEFVRKLGDDAVFSVHKLFNNLEESGMVEPSSIAL